MNEQNKKVPTVRFKGFTNDWEQQKLGDFGSVAMNKRIFKKQTTEVGDVPFYKIGTFGKKPDAYISNELFEEYKSKYPYPKEGDLLISASGSIGRIVEYKGQKAYYQDSNIVWLKHNDQLNNLFLKAFYQIVKWDGTEGSTIKRLYNKNILRTRIFLPTTLEQEKVGNIIECIERLLALQQRKLDLLKQFKKGLLQKMFADKDSKRPVLRFKGFHDDQEQRKLGEISDIKSGLSTNTQSKKNLYKITRIETISDGFIDVKKVGTVREKPDKKFLMNCGDILFSNINSLKHIGKVAIFDGSFTLYHGMNLLRITVNTKTSSYFIYYELSTKKYRNWAKAHANPAVSQASINQSELSLENMSLTSLAEQEKIVNLLLLLDKLISLQQQKLAKYQSIKKSLLQQMFI